MDKVAFLISEPANDMQVAMHLSILTQTQKRKKKKTHKSNFANMM
jgi:hypothetical protein